MVIIFNFKNKTDEEITINLEPSTDEFVLTPNNTITMESVSFNEDNDFQIDYFSDGIVIWIPEKSSIKVFINRKKVDTLYENFKW